MPEAAASCIASGNPPSLRPIGNVIAGKPTSENSVQHEGSPVDSIPRGAELLKLVQQRQRLLKDAWLAHVGHNRPGMNKGKPLVEAEREAEELDRKIHALAEGKSSAGGPIDSENRTYLAVLSANGDWVGWVGTYEDIVAAGEGQYRVRIMHNTKDADCAYPGVEVLPDGTFVATTYGHWTKAEPPYVVSVRFKLSELDAKLKSAVRKP